MTVLLSCPLTIVNIIRLPTNYYRIDIPSKLIGLEFDFNPTDTYRTMGILHCNGSLEEVELLYLTIILLMLLPSYTKLVLSGYRRKYRRPVLPFSVLASAMD